MPILMPGTAILARALIWVLLAMAVGGWDAIAPVVAQDKSVLTYHGDVARSGAFVVPGLTWERARALRLDTGFQASFPGHVYAQPLYWRGSGLGPALLIVATEDDRVHALDAATGKPIWDRSLGQPVPLGSLPCGNIDPLGVTGTPVIDEASQAIFLDAVAAGSSGPRHLVFALSLRDGSVIQGWPVDVGEALKGIGQTFNAGDQNQRGALTILDGSVYVPFGGHFGDCGDYHGRVVGISIENPKSVRAWSTRASGGGIWAPGGISSDGRALYVATGNTMRAKDWSDGEAVIRLAPDLRRSNSSDDAFAPSDWRALDDEDADLGGTNPLLLDVPSGEATQPLVLALGKDGRAYLLDRRRLGGIGGSLAVETVATDPIRTAPAAYPAPDGVFVALQGEGANCPAREGNLTALEVRPGAPPTISTAWCATMRGRGSPIVTTTDGRSNPIVWILGAEGDNRLHGYRGDTGEPIFAGGGSNEAMSGLHHFQTLIVARDRLYVAGDGHVYAFEF
jgi:PQQ enzyme repeat